MGAPESRKPYPTDLTDDQWAQIRDLTPAPKPGPQDAKYARREIVNTLLYQARTGCPWRFLPHDLPPWSVVKDYFDAWRDDGTFDRVQERLRQRVGKAVTRKAAPSLGIVDSQSVKTTEAGGPTGFDAGKKVKGRKRHILVDILGMILVVLVTAASVQDRDARGPSANGDARRLRCPREEPRRCELRSTRASSASAASTATSRSAVDSS